MFTFKKPERLCSKKTISNLFTNGKSFTVYPYKIVWESAKLNTKYPAQVAISVPKQNFKRAVKRNLIRRRIKEAYRTNKRILYKELKENNLQIAFMIIYISKDILDFNEIKTKIIIALQRLIEGIIEKPIE